MPRKRPDERALRRFFSELPAIIGHRWRSREGLDYDEVLYAVSTPYQEGDLELVLRWAGREEELEALPPRSRLNKTLASSPYPELSRRAPSALNAHVWSAVVHFYDPSYPLATPGAGVGLQRLGLPPADRTDPVFYARFVDAVDALKELAPAWAVPETNWYLSRIMQVGLEDFGAAEPAPVRASARARA